MVVIALPSALVPFAVEVIVFPSEETTVRTLVWYLPPFLKRSSVSVLASTCRMATVSHVKPSPITVTALLSYLAFVTVSILDPSARSLLP